MNRKEKCKQLEIEKARYEHEIEFWLKKPSKLPSENEVYLKIQKLAHVIIELDVLKRKKNPFLNWEVFRKRSDKIWWELWRKYDLNTIFERSCYKKAMEKHLQIKKQHEKNLERLLNEKPTESNPLNLRNIVLEQEQIYWKIDDAVRKLAYTICKIDSFKLLSENKRTEFDYKLSNEVNEIKTIKKKIYKKYHINEALRRLYYPERYE